MARKLILENLMKLAQGIGANPNKFMGTRTNITFLGKGPQKNPLFQRYLPGLENATTKNLGSRDALIEATEDAMGFASAGKLNDIQLKILTENLTGINKILNPPVLPSASVTPIRSGITSVRTSSEAPTFKVSNEQFRKQLADDLGSRLPEPGPGDVAAFTKALDQKTGVSRAIARNLLLKDTRLKLKPEELFMLKEGKGEPLDLMKKYYGGSMSAYDDFLNNVNLQAGRPDEFAEMILKHVKLIPQFAEGGLADVLQAPRRGYAEGGWSPGAGRDEIGYQSTHPSFFEDLINKASFFTKKDYDKVRYEEPTGKYATERWGKGEAPLAEATEDDEIVSYMGKLVPGETEKNLGKVKTLAHEKLHLLWEDPEVVATMPPWVQEQLIKAKYLWATYEQTGDEADYRKFMEVSSGIPLDWDKPSTGGGDTTGEELYTRFMENKYFPKGESDVGPWGDRIYFDKILKEHWDPYAEKFEKLMKSRKAKGGLARILEV